MEKEKIQKIKLGLFVVSGTLLFIISMYFIGDKQNLFGATFQINTIFSDVKGLQKGNNVRFSGIDVGTVKNIYILNDTSILVNMVLKEEVRVFIKKDAISTIGTDGLMGNKLVNISSGGKTTEMVVEGDTLPASSGSNTDQMLKSLEQTNSSVEMITNSLLNIITQIESGKGSAGRLIYDTTLAQNIGETLFNLNESSNKTTKILNIIEKNVQEINLGEGTVGALLMDTVFADNIEQMIDELITTSNNTKEITGEIKELIVNLKKGEGFIGNMLIDTTLTKSLEKSLENIQEGTQAFNENMEALKHNFLFRRYFKKKDKKDNSDLE